MTTHIPLDLYWPCTWRYSSSSSSVNRLPPDFDAGGTSTETSEEIEADSFRDQRVASSYIDFLKEHSISSDWSDRRCHRGERSISICRHRHTSREVTSWTNLWIGRATVLDVSERQHNRDVVLQTHGNQQTPYFRFTSFWNPYRTVTMISSWFPREECSSSNRAGDEREILYLDWERPNSGRGPTRPSGEELLRLNSAHDRRNLHWRYKHYHWLGDHSRREFFEYWPNESEKSSIEPNWRYGGDQLIVHEDHRWWTYDEASIDRYGWNWADSWECYVLDGEHYKRISRVKPKNNLRIGSSPLFLLSLTCPCWKASIRSTKVSRVIGPSIPARNHRLLVIKDSLDHTHVVLDTKVRRRYCPDWSFSKVPSPLNANTHTDAGRSG